jgi:hypothetical protein
MANNTPKNNIPNENKSNEDIPEYSLTASQPPATTVTPLTLSETKIDLDTAIEDLVTLTNTLKELRDGLRKRQDKYMGGSNHPPTVLSEEQWNNVARLNNSTLNNWWKTVAKGARVAWKELGEFVEKVDKRIEWGEERS